MNKELVYALSLENLDEIEVQQILFAIGCRWINDTNPPSSFNLIKGCWFYIQAKDKTFSWAYSSPDESVFANNEIVKICTLKEIIKIFDRKYSIFGKVLI